MQFKLRNLPRYTKKAFPFNHVAQVRGKCPECGFPYIKKIPTGNGAVYVHRNDWLHQVRHEK